MIGCTTCEIFIPSALFANIDAQILSICFLLLPHENVPVSSWSVLALTHMCSLPRFRGNKCTSRMIFLKLGMG